MQEKSKLVLLPVVFIHQYFCFIFVFPQTVANEHEERHKPIRPNASDPEEMETVTVASHVKTVRKKTNKKMDKATKKADNRGGKTGKDAKISEKKIGKKPFPYPKKEEGPKPTKKPSAPARGSLPLFLDHFENKRRLLVRDRPLTRLL